MVKRLTQLTEIQRERMPQWADEWIARGLSTEPADRLKVEAAIQRCYAYAGIRCPGPVIWVQSPLVGALAAMIAPPVIHALRNGNGKPDDGSAVDSAVYSAVGSAVGSAVDSAVDSAVGSAVDSAVRSAVGSANYQWHYAFGGRHWCSWDAFVLYFRECGLELPGDLWERAESYAQAQSAGWWWPNRDFVIASEPPTKLGLDSRGRLHCEDGPSVLYGDGWGVYAWHGLRITDATIIEQPGTITVARIQSEQNAELRRCLIQRYGQNRYLLDSEAKVAAKDDWGVLYRAKRPGDTDLVMVKVVNATPEPDGSFRDYFLRVPPTVKTPHEAIAWTFGKTESEYLPVTQT